MHDAHPGPPPEPHYADPTVTLHHQPTDGFSVLASLPDCSVDAVVTDPPYGIRFMGQAWDGLDIITRQARGKETSPMPAGVGGPNGGYRSLAAEAGRYDRRTAANREFQAWVTVWATECLRVLKPGGHLLSSGSPRTWHRLTAGIEDAGFEIRDSIAWLYGSGFPKSLDVSKAIDKAARGVPQGGVDPTSPNHGRYRTTITEGKRWDGDSGRGYGAGGSRFLADGAASGSATEHVASGVAAIAPDAERWQGWGTALKPAFEPIVVARKPLAGTVAANVLAHGTGALNIDGCRIEAHDSQLAEKYASVQNAGARANSIYGTDDRDRAGAAPHDSGRWPANVVLDESQAAAVDGQSGEMPSSARIARNDYKGGEIGASPARQAGDVMGHADIGGASRFFYVAKADTSERVRVNGTAHPTVKPLSLMRWLVRLVTPPGGTVLEPFAGSGTTVEACILEGFRCVAIEREADHLPLIQQRIHRRRDPVEAVKGSGEDGGLFDLLGEETA